GLPRFCGGAVGDAGYDTIRYVEELPNAPPDDRQVPDLCFGFYDRMVIFDHVAKTIAVVAHDSWVRGQAAGGGSQESGVSEEELRRRYVEACARVDQLVDRLQRGVADLQLTDIDPVADSQTVLSRTRSNFTRQQFESAVAKAREYINAGDIFQV